MRCGNESSGIGCASKRDWRASERFSSARHLCASDFRNFRIFFLAFTFLCPKLPLPGTWAAPYFFPRFISHIAAKPAPSAITQLGTPEIKLCWESQSSTG